MTEFRVIVLQQAKLDAREHVAFLAEKSVEAAEALRIQINKSLKTLSSMPQRYPFFNEQYIPANRYHKLFIEKYYLALFQVKGQNVYVETIIDTRREYPWLRY